MLDFVYENQTGDERWPDNFFRSVFGVAMRQLNIDERKIELGLHLILPEQSRALNLQYRQKDLPTDVLSFPLHEHGLEKHGILPLGDIFICVEVALRQANEMNIPINQEMARLAVHGILHLLGYDHEKSEEDEKRMIDLQEEILTIISKS